MTRQTLLDDASLKRLGLRYCCACGAGAFLGELCIYEDDKRSAAPIAVWCRDCEAGAEGATLQDAVERFNKRWDDQSDIA